MALDGIGVAGGAAIGPGVRARSAGASSGFRVGDAEVVSGAGEVFGTELVSGTVLLGLQESEGEAARDRAAKGRGRDLLQELAKLQRDVLRGRVSLATLDALAQLSGGVPEASDPGVRTAVAAVVLRARLELARYEAARPG